MDPFTQKLLERTQARKNQLNKKREDLDACRARRNSPIKDRSRRPLSEDNTDSGSAEIDTDDIKRRRIGSDDSDKTTVGKTLNDIDVNSPSVQARKDRLLKMQQKDQENGATPKKHWKAALVQDPNKEKSPSVATRSAVFEASHQKGQENVKDKIPCERQKVHIPGKLTETGNSFEKAAEHSKAESKNGALVPPKPPRSYTTEPNLEQTLTMGGEQPTKRMAPSPPKITTDNGTEGKDKNDKLASLIKRKAPEPPFQENPEVNINNTNESSSGTEFLQHRKLSSRVTGDKEEAGITAPTPTKRERKGSIENLNATNESKSNKPALKPRQKVQNVSEVKHTSHNGTVDGSEKRQQKAVANTTVTIVATPIIIDDGKRSKENTLMQKPQELCVIQACIVDESMPEGSSTNITNRDTDIIKKVESCHDSDKKRYPSKSENMMKASTRESKVCNKEVDEARVTTGGDVSSTKKSKKERQPKKKEDFEFRVPKRPTSARDMCPVDLDETVNLNEVNIHEMTFSFDFNQFDQQLEEQKDTLFVSYEEKCKQLEKEHITEEKKKEIATSNVNSLGTVCEKEQRGTYQSGYNGSSSEQYAAKTVPKLKPPVPEEPTRTQDAIKMLLEEAALQQNIVLQASQALNVCVANDITFRGSTEEIEAERVLLLASEHRTACLEEVQRLKMGSFEGDAELIGENPSSSAPSCIATLSFSGLKIILRQDFMDVLRVGIRSDLGVFYFVCIVQHGPHEFHCTRVLSTNDADKGNFLLFPEKFTLRDIKPDFNVTIKVFCMNVKKAVVNTIATPTKHKIFQSPKVVKGMFAGRRGSEAPSPAQVTPSPQTVFRTSSFSLVGITHINLPIIKSKRFSLDKVPDNCPLSNLLEVEADFSPLYSSHVKGFLTVLEDIGGYGAWQRRWCVLDSAVLSYWRYPGDESIKPPLGSIDMSECINDEVTKVARDLCARPNTMELKLKRSCGTEVKYLLAADTKSDRATWIDSLNEALRDGRAWTVNGKSLLYPDLSRIHNQDVYMCSKNSK
ncbi:anillin-like isoform X2 [Montipora capricornis]|uniref:anillin-like isoform X2 n=1 Tax=Montipora capricornis TaxID=246305 RepID=UPI0035F19827